MTDVNQNTLPYNDLSKIRYIFWVKTCSSSLPEYCYTVSLTVFCGAVNMHSINF